MSLTQIILVLILIALMTIALTLFNILFDIRYWEYRKRFEKNEKGIDPESGVSFKIIKDNTYSFRPIIMNFCVNFIMMSVVSGIIIYIAILISNLFK